MKSTIGPLAGLFIPLVLVVGLATGLFVRPSLDRLLQAPAVDDAHDPAHEDEPHADDHLPLSFEAVQNLNLLVRPVELSDFTEVRRMPGEIIESPGLSSQKVAAPVSGKVVRLFAAPGESIEPGDRLLELEIIDDELMSAQLRLLGLLTDYQITSAELQRLAPLAESGGIAGKRKLELEYEKQQTEASLSQTRQELTMRGLSADQIDSIEQSGKTIAKLMVVVPPIDGAADADAADALLHGASRDQLESSLAVESLHVEVGQIVSRGEAVCSLAVHGLLMVCGHAFEHEVDLISHVASDSIPVAIEFGTAERARIESGFTIQYVAGHVDETTQTYHFFIPLVNEVVRESKDSLSRVFRTWRYKVGQRVHVMVPTETLEEQIVLPREAVVQVGPEYFVFRELDADHLAHADGVYMEMEAVPVRVVTRDKQSYVIAPAGQVRVGDRVAVNAAYQMHLALKAQQEGGGHDHHHGHSH